MMIAMNKCKQFNEKIWLDFGKNLINNKELIKDKELIKKDDEEELLKKQKLFLEKQKLFLESCKCRKKFLNYMDKNLTSKPNSIVGDTDVTLDFDRGGLTEQEFINLSMSGDEQVIWDRFQSAGNDVLSFGFWGYATLDMIGNKRKEYIEPSFLARTGNGEKTIDEALKRIYGALEIINEALKNNTSLQKIDKIDRIDKAVRRSDKTVRGILRSMCNPAPRGKRVIFNECYLGKSYWRWYWADKMSYHITLSPKQIRGALNTKSYAVFAEKMHTGKSYIGSERLLGGLLMYMHESEPDAKKLKKIINQISYLSAWKALEMQDSDGNKREIQEISNRLDHS